MPITSQQVGGMIGGQQAMFGNFASYAQQISPGYGGPPPTYQNPMMGQGEAFQSPPPPTWGSLDQQMGAQMGPRAISAIGNVGLPVMAGAAMLGGSFLPGAAGRAIGGLDPFTAGIRGAGSAMGGWNMANMGRIASGGIGSIARAGISGIGGAAARAFPLIAMAQAAKYGVGQMVEGAQFQNQVQGVLNQNFRHVNPGAATGFGFSKEEGAGISGMIREMGHKDMMTSPQELLRVMQQGTQMGVFKAVQDAREFRKKFTDMVGALKEVSKVMNTTLEGAMPFFQQSRQMGFWTPQDIQRSAAQVHGVAATTGMSVAQVHSMMGQGAQMARQVGAQGMAGAQGMMQSMGLVGAGMRGGAFSERELSEATGGLQGSEAIASMAGTMQGATTRFAAGRQARWMLAAMGTRGFKGLDPGKMAMMSSGLMGLGEIGSGARRNIGKQGAFNFVMNEENLRGELIKQGPQAQFGFIQAIAGKHLYGEGAKSQYITRRLMKRYFGVGSKQADLLARMAREAPRLFEQKSAREGELADAMARQRDDIMNDSWEGMKRKASEWWDKTIKEPLQSFGAKMSLQVSQFWERTTDKFWGRANRGQRFRGMDQHGMQAMQKSMLGNTGAMEEAFGRPGQAEAILGRRAGGAMGLVGSQAGFGWETKGLRGWDMMANVGLASLGMGDQTNEPIEAMRRLGYGEYAFKSDRERQAAVQRGEVVAGATRGGPGAGAFRAFGAGDVKQAQVGLGAARGGIGGLTTQGATIGMGFGSKEEAQKALAAAQKEMGETSFMNASMKIRESMGDNANGAARAQRLIKMIQQGQVGGEALRKLVTEKGLSPQQAMYRLAAADPNRGGRAGVDLSEEFKGMTGVDMGDMRSIEKNLAEKMEAAAGSVGAVLGAGPHGMANPIKAEAQQKVIMNLFNKDKTGDYKRAMRLMATGKTPEEKNANRKRARDIFMKLANQKDRFTEEEGNVLRRMGDAQDPQRAALDRTISSMGEISQAQAAFGTAEMVHRRMGRLASSMGDQQEQILESMNKVSMDKAGGGKGGLGEHIRGMLTRGIDQSSPEALAKDIRDITRAAMEGESEDVINAAQQLKDLPGGEFIYTAMKAGWETKQAAKQLTGVGRFQKVSAVNRLMQGLGTDITKEELQKLQKDSSGKVQDKILGRIQDEDQKRNARILLEGIKGGKMEEIMKAGLAGARSRVAGTTGDPDKGLQNQLKSGIKHNEWAGQLGSTKGMHADMVRIRDTLVEISKAPGITGKEGTTDNPKEEPKK